MAELHAVTPLVNFVVACVIALYGQLKTVAPDVTKGVAAILDHDGAAGGASSTESSDEDDGYTRQRLLRTSDRRRTKRQEETRARRLTDFINGPVVESAIAQENGDGRGGQFFYKGFTSNPLRSLCTVVVVRPLYIKYVFLVVDGLETIGCNVFDNIESDVAYKRLTTCMPEFENGHARWTVQRRLGGSSASLWIQEQHIDKVAQLNNHLRSVCGFPSAALHIRHTVAPRYRGGRVDRSKCVSVSLTPRVVSSTHSIVRPSRPDLVTTVITSSGLSCPTGLAASPYATCVMEGLKRSAVATQAAALNHQPRKERRLDASAATARPPSSAAVNTSAAQTGGPAGLNAASDSAASSSRSAPGSKTALLRADASSELIALRAAVDKSQTETQLLREELRSVLSAGRHSVQPSDSADIAASMQTMMTWMQQQLAAMQQFQANFASQQAKQWDDYQRHQQHLQQQHMEHVQCMFSALQPQAGLMTPSTSPSAAMQSTAARTTSMVTAAPPASQPRFAEHDPSSASPLDAARSTNAQLPSPSLSGSGAMDLETPSVHMSSTSGLHSLSASAGPALNGRSTIHG